MAETPAKALIEVVDKDGESIGKSLTCLYNPSSITISRGAQWDGKFIREKGHKEHNYKGGGAATVSATLLFDTTLKMPSTALGQDVRKFTDFLFTLLEIGVDPKATDRPPFCKFSWGGDNYLIVGYLKSVKVNYKLFTPGGWPIRAEADVTFEETNTEKGLDTGKQNPTSHSAPRKTWIIREGDRLDWIAHQEYGSSSCWRHIAETNDIDDPFNLQTGKILKLVPLP